MTLQGANSYIIMLNPKVRLVKAAADVILFVLIVQYVRDGPALSGTRVSEFSLFYTGRSITVKTHHLTCMIPDLETSDQGLWHVPVRV